MSAHPYPLEIFEDLLASAGEELRRGNEDAFRSALLKASEYHAFFLRCNATIEENGTRSSYAMAGTWSPEYEIWNRRYHQLQIEASKLIPINDSFFEEVIRIPFHLIDRTADVAPPIILSSYLGQSLSAFHRLGDWWKEVVSVEKERLPGPSDDLVLSGIHALPYERVLRRFIGEYESCIGIADKIFEWERSSGSVEKRWSAISSTFLFAKEHLAGAAYLVGASVMRGDRIATRLTVDMLLRWGSWYELKLDHDGWGEYEQVGPHLFNLAWSEVRQQLVQPEDDYLYGLTPDSLARQILNNLLEEVLLVVAAISASWDFNFRSDKLSSDPSAAATAASSILLASFVDEEDPGRLGSIKIGRDIDTYFSVLLRLFSTGEMYEKGGHKEWLDSIASRIDRLTEREVVPGRIFTPSTAYRFDDFMVSFGVLLLACSNRDPNQAISSQVSSSLESIAGRGDDEQARSIQRSIESLQRYIQEIDVQGWAPTLKLITGVDFVAGSLLKPGEVPDRLAAAKNYLESASARISETRHARLDELEPSPAHLLEFAQVASGQLLDRDRNIPPICWFDEIEVVDQEFAEKSWTLSKYPKGRLTEPRMDPLSSNELEYFSSHATDYLNRELTLAAISATEPTVAQVGNAEEYFEAFQKWESIFLAEGLRPVLLVENRQLPPWIGQWMYREERENPNPRPAELTIVRDRGAMPYGYVATFNSTMVIVMQVRKGTSFLVSQELFQRVQFSAREGAEELPISVSYEEDQAGLGNLQFKWSHQIEVGNKRVVEISYLPADEN